MLRKVWWIAPVLAAFVGCGGNEPATTADTPTTVKTTDAASADAPKDVAVTLTSDEIEQIKALPEDEQTIALAQKVCPVGFDPADPAEGHLGSMKKPFKKVVDGKIVFLCCKGCQKDFDADPDTFLAKVEANKAKDAESK
ncbi:MAG: hypothetical protein ABI353_01850 [Isosphaeraceae bacterium]